MPRNIEIKLCCDDLDTIRSRALAIGATDQGVLRQTDTYFHAPTGRLKLREIDDARAELIHYARPTAASGRS